VSNSKDEKEKTTLSRRKFFGSAGTFLAGAAVTAAGCSALTGKKQDNTAQAATTWPLPYKKLDVEDVRARGFAGYYKGQ